MATFVKFTRSGGKSIWVNPEQIISCQPDFDTGGRTLVQTIRETYIAEENIEAAMARLGIQATEKKGAPNA